MKRNRACSGFDMLRDGIVACRGSWLASLIIHENPNNKNNLAVSLAMRQSAAFLACFVAGNPSVIANEASLLSA